MVVAGVVSSFGKNLRVWCIYISFFVKIKVNSMHMTQNKQQGAFSDPPSSFRAWFLSGLVFTIKPLLQS
jgi:hypothetical protein